MKKLLIIMLFFSLLLLTGCRSRITASPGIQGDSPVSANTADLSGGEAPADKETGTSGNTARDPEDSFADSSAYSTENPKSSYREYDENASAEAVPGASRTLQGEGEGDGNPQPTEAPVSTADQLDPEGERSVTRTVTTDRSERMGTSEEADEADTTLLYYTVLLQERLSTLFECKRKSLYWEMPEALRTIHRSDPIHKLILQAGCYDVSAKLLEENLIVTPDWVLRKDPEIIVKVTEKNVLGFGIPVVSAAQLLCEELTARPDWSGISAVRDNTVLLLSGELLSTPHLQTAAVLLIACTAYPELFSDVDADEALKALTREASGTPAEGILYYRKVSPT